jgi:hypothetical protein
MSTGHGTGSQEGNRIILEYRAGELAATARAGINANPVRSDDRRGAG